MFYIYEIMLNIWSQSRSMLRVIIYFRSWGVLKFELNFYVNFFALPEILILTNKHITQGITYKFLDQEKIYQQMMDDLILLADYPNKRNMSKSQRKSEDKHYNRLCVSHELIYVICLKCKKHTINIFKYVFHNDQCLCFARTAFLIF